MAKIIDDFEFRKVPNDVKEAYYVFYKYHCVGYVQIKDGTDMKHIVEVVKHSLGNDYEGC